MRFTYKMSGCRVCFVYTNYSLTFVAAIKYITSYDMLSIYVLDVLGVVLVATLVLLPDLLPIKGTYCNRVQSDLEAFKVILKN
jgi:hypothetical protein